LLITNKLKSFAAAKRETMPGVEHHQHKGVNNRAENSHQPTRRRERIMKRFKSAGRCRGFIPSMIKSPTFFPPPQPRHRRKVSFRPQSSVRHLGRGHRRGDGDIIMPVNSHRSNHRGPAIGSAAVDDAAPVDTTDPHGRWYHSVQNESGSACVLMIGFQKSHLCSVEKSNRLVIPGTSD
jgi:hypothetical protein